MKKTLVYGAATAVVVASLGAGFSMAMCTNSALYGPPPAELSSESAESDEPIEDVYGPPVLELDSSSSSASNSSDDSDDERVPVALYGPPPETGNSDATD